MMAVETQCCGEDSGPGWVGGVGLNIRGKACGTHGIPLSSISGEEGGEGGQPSGGPISLGAAKNIPHGTRLAWTAQSPHVRLNCLGAR